MKLIAVSLIFGIVAVILVCVELGYRFGRWHWAPSSSGGQNVSATIEASVFGLMGLLVAFSFSGAGSRFDIRRNLVATEANAIGTAYLRLDLLPPERQPRLREDFREYIRSRLDVSQKSSDSKAMEAAIAESKVIQNRIWMEAIEALKESGPSEKSLLLASLNEMIDITTTRLLAARSHPPLAVFLLLGLSVIASSALAGYSMAKSGARNLVFAF